MRLAESILNDVSSRAVGQHASPFNLHVQGATGLAIYGCGVLAATHVGALRALERHGRTGPATRTVGYRSRRC